MTRRCLYCLLRHLNMCVWAAKCSLTWESMWVCVYKRRVAMRVSVPVVKWVPFSMCIDSKYAFTYSMQDNMVRHICISPFYSVWFTNTDLRIFMNNLPISRDLIFFSLTYMHSRGFAEADLSMYVYLHNLCFSCIINYIP